MGVIVSHGAIGAELVFGTYGHWVIIDVLVWQYVLNCDAVGDRIGICVVEQIDLVVEKATARKAAILDGEGLASGLWVIVQLGV